MCVRARASHHHHDRVSISSLRRDQLGAERAIDAVIAGQRHAHDLRGSILPFFTMRAPRRAPREDGGVRRLSGGKS